MFLVSLLLKGSDFQKLKLLHALIQPDASLLYIKYESERKQVRMLKTETW